MESKNITPTKIKKQISSKRKKKYRVKVADNRVIVKFKEKIDEEERNDLRSHFGITNFEICSCGDKNLELWGVDKPEDLNVEDAVSELKRGGGRPEAEGDFHYTFSFLKAKKYRSVKENLSIDKNIAADADKTVNIAVLDTGIDPRYFGDQKFLLDTSKLGKCNAPSGWSFTGQGSANILDDHGHGTYVTKIISSYLDKKNIDYRILPIKVLNSKGKGSFWNILCAISYLERIQKEGVRIDLVNLSLGGVVESHYFNDNDFLKQTIQNMKSTLFVTSAGNGGFDTDIGDLRHFPSSYSAPNIMAVGGHRKSSSGNIKMHKNSNFGKYSIDIAAKFSKYSISTKEFSVSKLKGTSYAAAYATALAAEHYAKNPNANPTEIKEGVFESAPVQYFLKNKLKKERAILPANIET